MQFVLDPDVVSDLVDQPEVAKLVVARHRARADRFVVADVGSVLDMAPADRSHRDACEALVAQLEAGPEDTVTDTVTVVTMTAEELGAVLVTRDAELRRQAHERGIEVWHSRELVVHVVSNS